jgi:hypothetical protein
VLVEVGSHESSRYSVGSKPSRGCLGDRFTVSIDGIRHSPPGDLVLAAAIVVAVGDDMVGQALRVGAIAGERRNEWPSAIDVDFLKCASSVGDRDVGAKLTKQLGAVAGWRIVRDGVDDADEVGVCAPTVLGCGRVQRREVFMGAE